jgi:hypothetical protein
VNAFAEYNQDALRKERVTLHARCIALNVEQRRTLQGLVENSAGNLATAPKGVRGEALRKCASMQAEFLRVVEELRKIGQRLAPQAGA